MTPDISQQESEVLQRHRRATAAAEIEKQARQEVEQALLRLESAARDYATRSDSWRAAQQAAMEARLEKGLS